MIDVAIGIDIGTSFTKAVARTEDGTVIAIYRVRSPLFKPERSNYLLSTSEWWKCFKYALRGLLTAHSSNKLYIASICVSAITPTLTVFDATQEDRAYSILYSSLVEIEDGVSLSQTDSRLTEYRLEVLRNTARKEHFVKPYITDLVGYINWRLAGTLTLNSITLAETGMFGGACDCEKFTVLDKITPRLVAPSEQIGEVTRSGAEELGIDFSIPVCGGCPDTMSSVIGAGLTQTSETMLYLGTFGSFMRLETNIDDLLNLTYCPIPPFRWLLSVPGYGPEIESLSHRWFGSEIEADCMRRLDSEALKSSPGAEGTLFLLPRWKEGMTPIGIYEFIANRKGEIGKIQRQARAVLEAIAYAIIALGVHSGEPIKVGGGGARSYVWVDTLSVVLNSDVQARYMTWEATGTADIAAGLAWNSIVPIRNYYISQRYQDNTYREIIDDNSQRTKEYYHERDWF